MEIIGNSVPLRHFHIPVCVCVCVRERERERERERACENIYMRAYIHTHLC
jgi:hypothetical protein